MTTPASDQNATVAAGFLGWMLDASIFPVVMTLTAIARNSNKSDAAIALSITLTLVSGRRRHSSFGLLADRYGRKIPLMVDLVVLFDHRGAVGPGAELTTFLILRACSGSAWARSGRGASLVMERCRRDCVASCRVCCSKGMRPAICWRRCGYLLVFPHWGWRPLFFIGGLPALLPSSWRARVQESEVCARPVTRAGSTWTGDRVELGSSLSDGP